jgi:hypothetical protein
MTTPKPLRFVTFEPRPVNLEDDWQVVATYRSGQQELIPGFKTRLAAEHWISSESRAWLKKRGYLDPD